MTSSGRSSSRCCRRCSTGGRPEKHPRRAIVDAILYVVRTGCAWRQLPADFPPWQTVYWYFKQWEQARVTEQVLPALRAQVRVQQGRNPEPSAGIIDSQSVKGADTVGREIARLRRREEDQRPQAVHRHRHPRPAAGGERLGRLGARPRRRQVGPARHLPAHAGPVRVRRRRLRRTLVEWATQILVTTLHIVRKPADQRGFAVIPRRWVVERTFAWLTAHRRLARDYERDPAVSEAMIRWAAINTISRRIARGGPADPAAASHIPCRQLIFSNTFSDPNPRVAGRGR